MRYHFRLLECIYICQWYFLSIFLDWQVNIGEKSSYFAHFIFMKLFLALKSKVEFFKHNWHTCCQKNLYVNISCQNFLWIFLVIMNIGEKSSNFAHFICMKLFLALKLKVEFFKYNWHTYCKTKLYVNISCQYFLSIFRCKKLHLFSLY